MRKNVIATAIILLAAAPLLQAQVRVVESSPRVSGSGVSPSVSASAIEPDVYSQIRALQEEITTLRGMLEEQTYELKQLKQLQLDNYMDIDRRLSAARTAGQAGDSSAKVTISSAAASSAASLVAVPASKPLLDEGELYNNAYDQLNQRQYDASAASFKEYLAQYPDGKYASNCYYWLGKIAMLNQDYPQAKTWFGDLINRFPDSQKLAGAQLDMGRVAYFMGDRDQARTILNQVAGGNSEAAPLARKFLSDNF